MTNLVPCAARRRSAYSPLSSDDAGLGRNQPRIQLKVRRYMRMAVLRMGTVHAPPEMTAVSVVARVAGQSCCLRSGFAAQADAARSWHDFAGGSSLSRSITRLWPSTWHTPARLTARRHVGDALPGSCVVGPPSQMARQTYFRSQQMSARSAQANVPLVKTDLNWPQVVGPDQHRLGPA
jgi:hypothetical protein